MNFANAYKNEITSQEEKDKKKVDEGIKQASAEFASGLDTQNYAKWLKHPTTQAFLSEINNRIKQTLEFIDAVNYECKEESTLQIRSALIKVRTYNEILNYARRNN